MSPTPQRCAYAYGLPFLGDDDALQFRAIQRGTSSKVAAHRRQTSTFRTKYRPARSPSPSVTRRSLLLLERFRGSQAPRRPSATPRRPRRKAGASFLTRPQSFASSSLQPAAAALDLPLDDSLGQPRPLRHDLVIAVADGSEPEEPLLADREPANLREALPPLGLLVWPGQRAGDESSPSSSARASSDSSRWSRRASLTASRIAVEPGLRV